MYHTSQPENDECRKEIHTQFQIRKGGSAYGAFSRAFVTSVLTNHAAHSIIQWFNDTYAPEENVWATISSLPWIPGGYPIDVRHDRNQHASRAVAFQWDAYTCKGEYQRGVCVFTKADLPWLMQRPHLVANKFMAEKDQDVLDCLEETLFRRARARAVSVDQSYSENLPHVKFYTE
ncbi:hypothetical protein BaRGS_00002616 [Batillaria attramentaria]|uniref:Uncharacterized protein n=1 Tax=Batillaria attramentaria TaxID=370345 RepID=A0ABD0M1U9_9CAEN